MTATVERPEIGPSEIDPTEPPRRSYSVGRSKRRRLSILLRYAILVPGAILFVAPFAWLISASFQSLADMFDPSPHWIPPNPTLDGYKIFLGQGEAQVTGAGANNAWRWFVNSAFIATSVTILQLFFNSLAAYVFAKRKFPGRDAIFVMFLATMMIPFPLTVIPNYLVLKHIPLFNGNDIFGNGGHGWLDSYWGLILPGAVSAFGIFLLRQYMQSIPDDLLDAARIDGASEFRIYWQVVLPLCGPALAAVAIFTFIGSWEDFLWPLIIISSEDRYTAPLGLALFVIKNRTSWDVLFAGSVIATLPMVVIFMIFQRRFIQGISMTGIKG
jgi:multiple sugar transport system permease protein